MKIFCSTLVLVAALALPVAAGAQTLDQAASSYQSKDLAAVLAGFLTLAAKGNAHAQYAMGVMASTGEAMPRDEAIAVQWYWRAEGYGNSVFLVPAVQRPRRQAWIGKPAEGGADADRGAARQGPGGSGGMGGRKAPTRQIG